MASVRGISSDLLDQELWACGSRAELEPFSFVLSCRALSPSVPARGLSSLRSQFASFVVRDALEQASGWSRLLAVIAPLSRSDRGEVAYQIPGLAISLETFNR